VLEHLPHHLVVLNHAIGVKANPCNAIRLLFQVRPYVHASCIEQDEEWLLLVLYGVIHELDRGCVKLFVNMRHPCTGQWAGVLDPPVGNSIAICSSAEAQCEI